MKLLYGTIAVVVLLALAAAYYFAVNGAPDNVLGDGDADTEEATGPVARVNGTEISRETYDRAYGQYAAAFGAETGVTEAQLQEQALTDLINSALLKDAALAAGFAPTEEETDAEIAAIVAGTGGQEAFDEQIASAGITPEEVRAQIYEQLAMNAYLQSEANLESVTVTEEEITAFYEEASASNAEMPPLEEIRAQIEAQLTAQKQQELIAALIAELRANANIEILI